MRHQEKFWIKYDTVITYALRMINTNSFDHTDIQKRYRLASKRHNITFTLIKV